MKYVIDLDGTLCTQEKDYANANPIQNRINKVNNLYNNGNIIIIFTARGSETNIDWTDITLEQLRKWGVKYHHLIFGKPSADCYIDDRNIDCSFLDED